MKKLFLVMCFIVGFLLVPSAIVFAASVAGESVGVENVDTFFVSLAAMSAAVIPVTEFIKRLLKSSGGWTKFLSWIAATAISFVGWWLNLGILEGLSVIWVFIYGIAAGLVANSVFDIGIVEAIIRVFKGKIKTE